MPIMRFCQIKFVIGSFFHIIDVCALKRDALDNRKRMREHLFFGISYGQSSADLLEIRLRRRNVESMKMGYKGTDRMIAGIVFGVITFWLFAQAIVNVGSA